ncbi:MAG: hypothetical protein LBK00_07210 [Treponema sp.]|jgi:hypothetical protein|nr:hypothetical protein [Treponema sp.]
MSRGKRLAFTKRTLSLITNKEALAVSQKGGSPRQIKQDDEDAIRVNSVEDGAIYLYFLT